MAVAGVKKEPGVEKPVLAFLLVLGLIHGLLYIYMVPPWQHYDEPTQFEYAWLVANRASWPQPGDFDPQMRREVAASMVENNFFKELDFSPNLLSGLNDPVWLGVSQLGDRPLYYFLASIPLRFVQYTDVTFQLYATRFVSLILFLITLFGAWGAMGELVTDSHHPLRWMVPLSMALLPGFVDLMTSVNNDVAATAFFTLFLWGSIRLIKRGLTPVNAVWVLTTTALCVATKSTVYIAVPLAGLALLFGIFRGTRRKFAWISISLIAIAGLGFTLTLGENPANFYENNGLPGPTRARNAQAPVGKYVFELDVTKKNDIAQIQQPILPSILRSLGSKEMTIGGWFWADQPVEIYLPQMILSNSRVGQLTLVALNEKPQFFAYTVQMPSGPEQGWLKVLPYPPKLSSQTSIFIDGLILVEGNFSAESPPIFSDDRGSSGAWDNREFQNLIQNGSAESGWPGFRSWAENFLTKYFPGGPAYLWATLDWKWAIPYFKGDLGVLFRTFWAEFGWGNVPLAGNRPYRLLIIVTIVGLIGAVASLWKNRHELDMGLFSFGLIALLGIWGMTLLRGVGSVFERTLYPVARYAYPSVLLTAVILNVGWFAALDYGLKYVHLPRKALAVLYVLLFLGFDVFALWSLHHFYAQF